ncbi:cold shock protein 1 [Nicotiana attenuata]|nr:cold shock protein 1 [Nicotiana attenuata]
MVSKRQKLARKRYKEEHPELFPKPEPTPPKDPNKKKKKKSNFKKRKGEGNDPNKKRLLHKKHPFRVAGMKPGESCFICKEHDHIAKDCPRKSEWEKNKICLLCRRRGHSLKNCPNKDDEKVDKKLCYNCGETSHSLANCPYPLQDGGTKFASCFICKEQGHLSKNCPKSTHGIYPKGGCCKICGGVTHLAKDCPNKTGKASDGAFGRVKAFQFEDRPRGQVTKLSSGDDLEDDFMAEEVHEDGDAKLKKKKEPKVVNFVG